MAYEHNHTWWIHGINLHVENIDYIENKNGLEIERTKDGTTIRQYGRTGNTFHLAIPTPTKLDDDDVKLYDAWLRGSINNYCMIKDFYIYQIENSDPEEIFKHKDINLTSKKHFQEYFDLNDSVCKGPLIMTMNVVFEGNASEREGEITIKGGGVRFEEM